MMRGVRCRVGIAWCIALRGLRSALQGMGLYAVAFTSSAVAAAVVGSYVGVIAEDGLLVSANPLVFPLNVAITIGAIYSAVVAAVSVSRERESGTMEVLFFGPVDATSYVGGKHLEQLLSFALTLLLYLTVFLILGHVTNLAPPLVLLPAGVLAIPLVSSITAFGMLLSSLTNRTRTSVILLLAVLALFLCIQWADSFLSVLDARVLPPAVLYGKALLAAGATVIQFISPFAYLDRGLQVLALCDARGYAGALAASAAYSLVLLALTVVVFRRKGVRTT